MEIQDSASVKVLLYTSWSNKAGKYPVMLRIIKDRKSKYLSLKLYFFETEWDYDSNLPVKKTPNFNDIRVKIKEAESKANKVILSFENEKIDYTAEMVIDQLKEVKSSNTYTVFEFIDYLIQDLKKQGRIGYADVFKETKRTLKNFRNNKDFSFKEIDYKLISDYEKTLIGKGMSLNSAFVFMRTFRTIYLKAKKEGLLKMDIDAFKDIDFKKYRKIKTRKRAIKKSDLLKIIELDIERGTSMYNSRAYFLFSYYCLGLNFIDLAHLKWTNINSDRLYYKRKKTDDQFNISLLEPAKEIINYFKQNYFTERSGYIFPILNEKHQTPESVKNRTKKILKQLNKDLKAIAIMAGLEVKLTSYVARHSFATIMKSENVPTAIISELMGHETEKITQTYLDEFDVSVKDEATKVLLLN